MPSPSLQRLPFGLLGFFDLKNGGQYPQDLDPRLGPTLDLTPWYLETNAEILAMPAALAIAAGNNISAVTIVPNTEWWYVADYFIQIADLLAAENLTAAPAFFVPNTSWLMPTQALQLYTGAAGAGAFAIGGNVGKFLPPGTALALTAQILTGGATWQGAVRATRLRI